MHNQGQPARECETPQYLSVSRNLAEALGSSQRLSVWDQRPVKKYTLRIKHTHMYTQSLGEVKKCQTVVLGGDSCGLDVCLCQMNDVIFPPTLWKMREGESDWSESIQGERMPGRCQLTPSLPFSSSRMLFFILYLCPSSSLLLTPLPLIFSLSLWGLEASQTAPSWNRVWRHSGISVIIKPALRLPNTSSLMRSHTHAHIYTHHLATWSNHFSHRR